MASSAASTDDEAIVDKMRHFVQNIDKHAFEFQMLYGVRRDLQRRLAAEGYGVRVYIPFGPEWYPYFMRRLAERPPTSSSSPKTSSRTRSVPDLGMRKNKVQKSGVFLAPRKGGFPTTFHHAFHHILTIKKPLSNTHFFQNPFKKASKNDKIPRRPHRRSFPQKNSPHSILGRNRLCQ